MALNAPFFCSSPGAFGRGSFGMQFSGTNVSAARPRAAVGERRCFRAHASCFSATPGTKGKAAVGAESRPNRAALKKNGKKTGAHFLGRLRPHRFQTRRGGARQSECRARPRDLSGLQSVCGTWFTPPARGETVRARGFLWRRLQQNRVLPRFVVSPFSLHRRSLRTLDRKSVV